MDEPAKEEGSSFADSPAQAHLSESERCSEHGVTTSVPSNSAMVYKGACEIGPMSHDARAAEALHVREEAAHCRHHDPGCKHDPVCRHPCNGDEAHYYLSPGPFHGQYIACFSKGLPHNATTGLVDPGVYSLLLKALATGDPAHFESIGPLGCRVMPRKLEDPQGGYAFELEGADPQALYMRPAPCFHSEQEASEIAENYWMALTRDVPFASYSSDALIARAVGDMNNPFSPAKLSPHLPFAHFDGRTLFRGPGHGDRKRPHVSQFMLMDVPYGAQFIPATIRTLRSGIDFMTHWDDWLKIQDGCDADQTNCDPVPRFIRNGRDLAQFVHVDRDFNGFFNACLLMLYGRSPLRRCEATPGLGVPFGPCLPYINPMAPPDEEFQGKSNNQIGQGTFGEQHFKSILIGSLFRAFHAVWFQKWMVHRRLRPEEFGGRVHLAKLHHEGMGGQPFPVHPSLFNSALFKKVSASDPAKGYVFEHNQNQNAGRGGSYLLPMAYAEGSPLHPSYGSGHSTAAGCMATLLKAIFRNDWRFNHPVEANENGTALRPYTCQDSNDLTVADEVDKLASNIGLGRVWAGVHWRSDHEEAMILGEQMAISILCNQRNLFNEPFEFRFRSFDFGPHGGKFVRIRPGTHRWHANHPERCGGECVETIEDYAAPCGKRRRVTA